MATIIKTIAEAISYDIDKIDFDEKWNLSDIPEHKIHSIHAYPAKFPAFIAEKAINYARDEGINVTRICDIFCGCGTVALEAKRYGIDFWGCDINPVATLIAKVKSDEYIIGTLEKYYQAIINQYESININSEIYETANERLQYWFDQEHYIDLKKLLMAINSMPNNKYRRAFLCLFSSILKSTSRWLTKSIKPQLDPNKKSIDTRCAFDIQYNKFIKILRSDSIHSNSSVQIVTGSFLTKKNIPPVNLIITSPPYVTSYEYADLHQLSSLWLGYTKDYKTLRKGTIGSVYNCENYYFEIMDLNETGKSVIEALRNNHSIDNSKIKSVARYFIDMQHTAQKCYDILCEEGMAFFVVGDTEYKDIKICNSRHLVESLIRSGFQSVRVSKRKISKKILTPYRDEKGKFTTDKNKREVYHEEFVIIGIKRKVGMADD
ncbi:DNA methyltransferase [Caproiciproducens sp. CPB-2]|uniref:DNA methyltransferase n=1 Tax=Caproiciproducens sp. CPB-2 TaxID=3030017 RepID=UPI0023DC037D|nr:class I SAM-dependent methyltransferase [Caproiciproducens sp. CPB-2]MDF1496240.1 class I SAM-dependent methyltransferase [Caproiciproducens sp. CPB-2]